MTMMIMMIDSVKLCVDGGKNLLSFRQKIKDKIQPIHLLEWGGFTRRHLSDSWGNRFAPKDSFIKLGALEKWS